MKLALFALLLPCALLGSDLAKAAILQVGPGRVYSMPCQAITAAASGDTIEIDPGTYTDDFCTINVDNLTIKGAGSSRPHLEGTVPIPNKKGIFVIPSGVGPITVENIEFSGAQISAADGNNAAGIRMQGSELIVRNCYFHHNQNGILAGGTADYTVLVEHSEFDSNGNPGSGQEHNIYISGDCQELTFRYNYSHHAMSGHNLKSRARVNYILYNRIMDESDGTASYTIDLPQGGRSYLIGNLIQMGPLAENTGTIVSYKAEAVTNPELNLYVTNNTFVNDLPTKSPRFIRVSEATVVTVVNNLFVGNGTPVDFPNGTAGITYTNSNNLATSNPGLEDQAAYNYRLTGASPAIDQGIDPGSAQGFDLSPVFQYLHPTDKEPRPAVGIIDIGAYEYPGVIPVDAASPPADATVDSTVDAASPPADATVDSTVDAASPPADATVDAASPLADATVDAATPPADATVDAATPLADATVDSTVDAATPLADAQAPPDTVSLPDGASFPEARPVEDGSGPSESGAQINDRVLESGCGCTLQGGAPVNGPAILLVSLIFCWLTCRRKLRHLFYDRRALERGLVDS